MENYSLSDIAAASGDGGFGGNSAWVLIILFVLIFGLNGNGFGRTGELGQYATAASQQEILFGQRFDALGQKINQIGDGICSSTYALNNAIKDGNYALGSQLSECCCTTQRNTDALRYDMATQNAGLQAMIHSEGEQTRALLQQNKIEALQGQINQLQLQSAMSGVVKYPMQSAWAIGGNPFCGGCGCQ